MGSNPIPSAIRSPTFGRGLPRSAYARLRSNCNNSDTFFHVRPAGRVPDAKLSDWGFAASSGTGCHKAGLKSSSMSGSNDGLGFSLERSARAELHPRSEGLGRNAGPKRPQDHEALTPRLSARVGQ